MSGHQGIKAPDDELPAKFKDAYAELLLISAALKPPAGDIPDIDAIEPLIRRANKLAELCEKRIEAVRALVERDDPASQP